MDSVHVINLELRSHTVRMDLHPSSRERVRRWQDAHQNELRRIGPGPFGVLRHGILRTQPITHGSRRSVVVLGDSVVRLRPPKKIPCGDYQLDAFAVVLDGTTLEFRLELGMELGIF
jgi:hypothetical protein